MAEVAVAEGGERKLRDDLALFRPRRRRAGVRIDMTPMVDVAFLLLIFFMVTTVFRRPLAVEVNLPEPGARVEVPESRVATVYVDRDGTLRHRLGSASPSPVRWEDLPAELRRLDDADPDLIVLVKIHRAARYETMVGMLDLLEDADLRRFSLVPMAADEDAAPPEKR